jgi:Ni/Fe-hydrogenase 1 B-type cytochrome subunit
MKNEIWVGVTPRLRVYVWEFPLRFCHWTNALCITILSITGFYIGDPFIHAYSSKQYIMGWIRFIHFIAAYTFMMSMIIRLYWGIMGNRYANFRTWFPFSAKKFGEVLEAIKFYLFIRKEPPPTIGHHALASLTYLILFSIFIFEIVSGFALYSVNHSGILWTVLGGWLVGIMHLPTIKLFHHLFMYVILSFFLIHIYSTWYSDPKERNGLVSSIFSGFKFTEKIWDEED